MSNAPAVFLSYAKEDSEVAERLYDALTLLGARPWMDSHDLIPGQDWKREIRSAIQRSDFVILLLSQRSVSKQGFVQREIREALEVYETLPEGRVYLIPARAGRV